MGTFIHLSFLSFDSPMRYCLSHERAGFKLVRMYRSTRAGSRILTDFRSMIMKPVAKMCTGDSDSNLPTIQLPHKWDK
jgi:hypothetical protein